MANSYHKVTVEFETATGSERTAGGRCGWTEQWYDPVVCNDEDALSRSYDYLKERLKLLTSGYQAAAIRVSQLTATLLPRRKGQLVFISPEDGKGKYQAAATDQDEQAYDAVEISINGIAGARRNFQMRGIPNNLVNAGSRYLAPPAWVRAFSTWLRWLNGQKQGVTPAGAYAIRQRTNTVLVPISGISIGPTPGGGPPSQTNPQITIDPRDDTYTPAARNFVDISGVRGMSHMNGTWQIDTVDQLGTVPITWRLRLMRKRRIVCEGVPNLNGMARIWSFSFDPILTATTGNGTSRRTGRPPQQPRGRRSNRPS